MFDYIFQVGLLSHVNVEEHPNLTILCKSSEDWSVFVKVVLMFFFLLSPCIGHKLKKTIVLHGGICFIILSFHAQSLTILTYIL